MDQRARYPSPGGHYVVDTAPWEVRMSLWIESPTVFDAQGGVVFSFADSHWSLDKATWRDEHVVDLLVRKYPGDHKPDDLLLSIDCAAGQAHFQGRALALHTVERTLEAALDWHHRVKRPPARAPATPLVSNLSPAHPTATARDDDDPVNSMQALKRFIARCRRDEP